MADAALLLPDFLLIVLGWLLCRHTALNRPLWDAVERLVYHLLFPGLLFHAILRHPLQIGEVGALAACALGVMLSGVALAFAVGLWPGVDRRLYASGQQTAFRFNSYVALALSERLAGTAGLAWMGLILALCVPVANVAAVWPLARHGGRGTMRELARNPLIIATLAGLAASLAGLKLPDVASTVVSRIGAAALPLGLMAVGAGLHFGALRESPRLATALMLIRHLALPAVALAMVTAAGLPPAQQAVVVAFAALPTASSAYVLAVRMGGHGPFVAGLITVSTLASMVGLPAALSALRWVSPP